MNHFLPLSVMLLASSLSLAAVAVSATELELEGALWEAPALEATAVAKLRLSPEQMPQRAGRGVRAPSALVLPPLSVSERERFQATENTTDKQGVRIGITRKVTGTFGDPLTWQWLAVAGGRVAHMSLQSPEAKRIRAQLDLQRLPAEVELRFYAAADPNTVYGPYTHGVETEAFWSPSIAGDTLTLEVFVPDTVPLNAVNLGVSAVAHTALDLLNNTSQSEVMPKASTSCFLDMACATPEWQQRGKSTAFYFVVDGDSEYSCTGELLNSSGSSRLPYFLTANHCVGDAKVAATLNAVWFYENSTCGGGDWRNNAVLIDGGAKLLTTDKALDTTLLVLNKMPTKPVLLAGWSATPLEAQQPIVGIHHSASLPKKYSSGYFLGHGTFKQGALAADPNGEFNVVRWEQGVAAKGASGSALWFENSGKYYVKGVLSRGSSSCEKPNGTDLYMRFDQAYPLLKRWLNP